MIHLFFIEILKFIHIYKYLYIFENILKYSNIYFVLSLFVLYEKGRKCGLAGSLLFDSCH